MTVKEIIEAAFVGKRARFPGLSQAFEREEVHTIEAVHFNLYDETDEDVSGEVLPDSGVGVVFTTAKPKIHPRDAEKAWVYYDLDSPVEFIGAQE